MKNAFTRAIKYLKFKKAKSIVLVMLFTLLSLTLLLSSSVNSTIDSYYSQLDTTNGISVSINPVMSPPTQDSSGATTRKTMSFASATDEQLEQIKALDYVTNIKNSTTVNITSDTVNMIEYTQSTSNSQNQPSDMPSMTSMSGLKITGSDNLALENDFANETVSLSSGVMPTAKDQIVISESLATLNSLKVGDSIVLKSSDASISVTYKISGIYKYNADIDEMAQRTVPENTMYATYEAATQIKDDSTRARVSTTYYISSTDKLEQFKTDYFKITEQDSSSFNVTLNDEVYTSTIKPLMQLSETLSSAIIVIIAFIGVILAIVAYLMIKERNYEIGVLYSLSESKKNIVFQFIFESTILLTIGFILALIINFALASSIINGLLNMDLFSSVNENAMRMQGPGMSGPMSQSSSRSSSTSVVVDANISILSILSSYVITWVIVCGVNILTISKTLLKRVKEIINS